MSPRTSHKFAFHGEWTIRLSKDPRIRLPIDAIRQLQEAAVEALRPFPVPKSRVIYLIPSTDWDRQLTELQDEHPELREPGGYLAFLAPSTDRRWDTQGRLLLPRRYLRDHASLQSGDDVVLVGFQRRFEVWPEDDHRGFVDRFRMGPDPGPPGD